MEYCEYPIHAWSRHRHFLRRQCVRKARLSCLEARAGADTESETPLRLLHDLRRRITLEQYLGRIFDQTVRQNFYCGGDDEPDLTESTLSAILHRRFDRDLELMLCGAAARDHKLCFLRELEAKSCNLTALVTRAGTVIDGFCAAFSRELSPLITSTPPLCRRDIASPLAVYINELCCYCAPLLALEKNGELWIVENNCDDRVALLHKFYAVNSFGREPHLVRSFAYSRTDGVFKEAGIGLNVSETLRQISEDGAAWAELIALPLENLPFTPEHCPECGFNFFCNKYSKRGVK